MADATSTWYPRHPHVPSRPIYDLLTGSAPLPAASVLEVARLELANTKTKYPALRFTCANAHASFARARHEYEDGEEEEDLSGSETGTAGDVHDYDRDGDDVGDMEVDLEDGEIFSEKRSATTNGESGSGSGGGGGSSPGEGSHSRSHSADTPTSTATKNTSIFTNTTSSVIDNNRESPCVRARSVHLHSSTAPKVISLDGMKSCTRTLFPAASSQNGGSDDAGRQAHEPSPSSLRSIEREVRVEMRKEREREKWARDEVLAARVRKFEREWMSRREDVRQCEWGILTLEADIEYLVDLMKKRGEKEET